MSETPTYLKCDRCGFKATVSHFPEIYDCDSCNKTFCRAHMNVHGHTPLDVRLYDAADMKAFVCDSCLHDYEQSQKAGAA